MSSSAPHHDTPPSPQQHGSFSGSRAARHGEGRRERARPVDARAVAAHPDAGTCGRAAAVRPPSPGAEADRGGAHADRKSTRSELQSLMRISYAVFCLKKKKHKKSNEHTDT